MRTTNALLGETTNGAAVGSVLPSESVLAGRLDVSRTAIRAALGRLAELGVTGRDGRAYVIRRPPHPSDYYETSKVESRADLVERRFMEMALGGELMPGARFSEAELARRIGVSTVSVREFLISFSRYGLIEKEPRGGWRLCAFDQAFGHELASVRRMFEIDAIRCFATAAADDPVWREIDVFIRRHVALREIHTPALFATLDREFHRFIVGRLRNRFVETFYDVVALVFHYHYQWDRQSAPERNAVALREHEAVLEALADRDIAAAERALDAHLATALHTLIVSIGATDTDGRGP
jgi:DNA-binding GntR family transcriptional regulator